MYCTFFCTDKPHVLLSVSLAPGCGVPIAKRFFFFFLVPWHRGVIIIVAIVVLDTCTCVKIKLVKLSTHRYLRYFINVSYIRYSVLCIKLQSLDDNDDDDEEEEEEEGESEGDRSAMAEEQQRELAALLMKLREQQSQVR